MRGRAYFPAVACVRDGEKLYRASAAIRVRAIETRMTVNDNPAEREEDKARISMNHYLFLAALTQWPEHVDISFNVFSEPDIGYPRKGKLEIFLVVSVSANNRKRAIAEVLGRHGAFNGLLNNFFPGIEFGNVVAEDELHRVLQPFIPVAVTSFCRRSERFVVTGPESSRSGRKKSRTIGFLATEAARDNAGEEDDAVAYYFPWIPADQKDISTVAEAMLLNPAPLWYQVRLRPGVCPRGSLKKLRQALYRCEDLLARGPGSTSSLLSAQLEALCTALTERMQQLGNPVFSGGIFLASTAPIDGALSRAIAATISPGIVAASREDLPLYGGVTLFDEAVKDFLLPRYSRDTEPITAEEATTIFRLPQSLDPDIPGLPIKNFRTTFAHPSVLECREPDAPLLGQNIHRGYTTDIKMSVDDRMHHQVIMGQTGTGKSTLLSNIIVSDIKAGRGLCLLDPHGDLLENVLQRYPLERKDDLVLIDFLDQEHVVPMNLLVWKTTDERDFIIDELYCWLDQAYDMKHTGGPMFELYFRNFLRVLMGDAPRKNFVPTIGDFSKMFSDSVFRKLCCNSIRDQNVLQLMEQAKRAGGDASLDNIAPYIISKFNRFDLDLNLKRMVGQEKLAIDFHDIMDRGKVMLVNLGRGRLGETVSGLLASQIVSRFKAAGMKRALVAPGKRKDFFLYVDEFQNIASESFISMLSEARKFRLGLVLANQYASQLEELRMSGGSVLRAILGNVGSIINFRLGVQDAELLEPVFNPTFNRYDLTNLPRGNCYVNLKAGGRKPVSFSMETVYKKNHPDADKVAELRKNSLEKYAITVEEADKNLHQKAAKIEELTADDFDASHVETLFSALREE